MGQPDGSTLQIINMIVTFIGTIFAAFIPIYFSKRKDGKQDNNKEVSIVKRDSFQEFIIKILLVYFLVGATSGVILTVATFMPQQSGIWASNNVIWMLGNLILSYIVIDYWRSHRLANKSVQQTAKSAAAD